MTHVKVPRNRKQPNQTAFEPNGLNAQTLGPLLVIDRKGKAPPVHYDADDEVEKPPVQRRALWQQRVYLKSIVHM